MTGPAARELEQGNAPASLASAPMRWWERLSSGVIGLGVGGAGTYAVFATSNQAGSAVLVVAGAAFLLVGVQNTRLVRFGGGGNSIELAQHLVASRLIEHAEQEKDPEVAEHIAEVAADFSPAARSPRRAAGRWEDQLEQALQRIGTKTRRRVELQGGREVDFLVEYPSGGRSLIETKPRSYGTLAMQDIQAAMALVEYAAGDGEREPGLLIVTNAPLSGSVQEFNASPPPAGRKIEVISWNDERDDGLLSRALARVAR